MRSTKGGDLGRLWQHFLYLRPLPHGQGSLRFGCAVRVCSAANRRGRDKHPRFGLFLACFLLIKLSLVYYVVFRENATPYGVRSSSVTIFSVAALVASPCDA